mgnify:FL=1|jgi:beta-N-acetylhexosaminidase
MIDIESVLLSDEDINVIKNPHVGGIILFERNFKSRDQIKDLCANIREVKKEILIAVDHEGGRVQRFKNDFTHIPPMQSIGNIAKSNHDKAIKLANDIGWLIASELISCGVDISFTPVLDLDIDMSTIIGNRAFSDDPQIVIDLAESLILGMQDAGMVATGKHFPGHGGVKEDSHIQTPIDSRELDELFKEDLKPYVILQNLLGGVMSAHLTFPKVDNNAVSFSYFWLTTILRQQLGFEGVVFSDDLSMKGADVAGNYSDKAQKALDAGCDMLLVCNNRKGVIEVLEYLEENQISKSSKIINMLKTKEIDWNDLVKNKRRDSIISSLADMDLA